MPRLFVAIDLPDDVRQAVCGLRESIRGFRWVPQEQLHLTLRFIGDMDEGLLERVKERVSTVQFQVFAIELNGIGHFPPRGLPRVIWAGITSGPELFAVQKQVEQACVAAGIPHEPRCFSPHLTLARLKDPLPETVTQFELRHAGFRCGPVPVNAFHLYESTLTGQCAIHRKLVSIAAS